MAKLKNPLFSLGASNTLAKVITFVRRRKQNIAEQKPIPTDAKSLAQLSWRHMYQKAVALWHALSADEKQDWESSARPKHMTGFAWFMSQALKPNPGLYLPLQGGIMQGIIDMDGYPIQDLKDPVGVQDGDTKAARDAAIAAAIGGSLTCDIYGYDGSNWQKLLVEDAAYHNLRVRLYDRTNPVTIGYMNEGAPNFATHYGLDVKAMLYCLLSGNYARPLHSVYLAGDGDNGYNTLPAALVGYNGASYDRLRTWGTGVLKIGRDAIDSTTVRITAAGAVIGGARKLFWIACSPDAPGAEFELTDAIAGGGDIVYDHFDPDKHSEHLHFDPPMKFANGIWIEKFDHFKSLVFCYI